MYCKLHPDITTNERCEDCGVPVCEKCSISLGGKNLCPKCAINFADKPKKARKRHHVYWGLLFIFSVIIPVPGLGYMYMGLIKRGILTMISIALLFALGGVLAGSYYSGFPLFVGVTITLIACIIALAVIFDGFRIRRLINDGETVEDDLNDVAEFLYKHRGLIVIITVGILILYALTFLIPFLIRTLTWVIPLLIAFLVLRQIFKKPSKRD